MKKVFIVVIAAVVLIGSVFMVFLETFDMDKFRPLLIKEIEAMTGRTVELGHVAIAWDGGIALELNNLSLFSNTEKKGRPAARFQQAAVIVRLLPLLRKKVLVFSMILKGSEFDAERASDGNFTVAGITLSSSAAPKELSAIASREEPLFSIATAEASDRESPPFFIDQIRVKDGIIFFHDKSHAVPFDLNITSVDATIKNISFTAPVEFTAKMAILSFQQNLAISGQLELPTDGRQGVLDNVLVKSDLGLLALGRATKIFPALKALGLQNRLAGHLQINVDHCGLGPQGLKFAKASLYIKEGKISFKDFRTPIEHLNVDVLLQRNKIHIRGVTANFAKGTLKILGKIDQTSPQVLLSTYVIFKDLSIESIMPPAATKDAPGLTGRVSVDFQGSASGAQWSQISRTLSGTGRLTLRHGVFLNYNIFHTVIKKISEIPGVGEAIRERFPKDYQAKLNEQNTILMPADLRFTVSDSQAHFDNFILATDIFSIKGNGEFSPLNDRLYAKSVLQMNPVESKTLITAVPEVQILANPIGLIEIPLTIQGAPPNLTVVPDVDGLTSKIMAAKTEEMVSGLLNKPGQGIGGLEVLLANKQQGVQKQ